MLNRVWCNKNSTLKWKPKLEEHIYSDGSNDYSYFDGFRNHNVEDWEEAQRIIKEHRMEEITEQMIEAGWISRK